MKNLISPLLIFVLYCASAQSAEDLKYRLLFHPMSEKIKMVSDPQAKGLIAHQLYEYYVLHGKDDFQSLHYIYPSLYDAHIALNREKKWMEYQELIENRTRQMADSAFNQYHGHFPAQKRETSVDVRSIYWSEQENHFFSAGGDGKILRWNTDTRTYSAIYQSDELYKIVDFDPANQMMAIADNSNRITILDLNDLSKEPMRIKGHVGAEYDLKFIDGGYVSVGADRKLMRTIYGQEPELITSVNGIVKTIAVSPDQKWLAYPDRSGEVVLLSLSDGQVKTLFFKGSYFIDDIAFSPDGQQLLFGGSECSSAHGFMILWDLESRKKVATLTGFTAPVYDVGFDGDGKLVAGASTDKTLRLWSVEQPYDLPIIIDDHNDWVFGFAFDLESKAVYTASADGLIRRFPLDANELAESVSKALVRDFTDEEWRAYVGDPNTYPKPRAEVSN